MLKSKRNILQTAQQTAKVFNAVQLGINNQVINFTENTCYIVSELMVKSTNKSVYLKNLYLYARLKKLIDERESLFVKDWITGKEIGYVKNGIAKLYV